MPILQRAQELWRELEAESGRSLLTLTDGLMIGRSGNVQLAQVIASAQQHGIRHKVLRGDEVSRMYPQHLLEDDEYAVLDHHAGVLRPEFAVLAAARSAVQRGATIHADTVVDDIDVKGDRVVVRTSDESYEVGRVILTPGPWLSRFVPRLRDHVVLRKEIMTWYPALDPSGFMPDRFPVFIRYGSPAVFGIPTLDNGSVKVAGGVPKQAFGEPEELDRNVVMSEVELVNQAVRRTLRGLAPSPVRISVYMDAYTTDRHPIIGNLHGAERVLTLAGFSGHGFKMAPAIGEIATDLVCDGGTNLPIDHMAATRFL